MAITSLLAGNLAVVPAVAAAPIQLDDVQGADDEPGQKDLSFMTVDYEPETADTIVVTWGWDDTATSGNNTRDACTLFDTNVNGNADFSYCIVVATNNSVTTQLYECTDDSRVDRCGGPEEVTSPTSSGTADIVNDSDPFRLLLAHQQENDCDDNPDCNSDDTVGVATVGLLDIAATSSDAVLLNVCSYPSGEPNSSPSDCILALAAPAMNITKTAISVDSDTTEPFEVNAAGDVITYSITVANTGNTTLTEVSVDDTLLSNADCDGTAAGPQTTEFTIAVGATLTCTGSYTVTQDDIDAGGNHDGADEGTAFDALRNIATAESTQTEPDTDDAIVPVDRSPSLNITKTAISVDSDTTAPFEVNAAGDVITYSITVANTGNTTLTEVSVDDLLLSNEDCDAAAGPQTTEFTIAVGATLTCTGSYTVTQDDIDAGGNHDGADEGTAFDALRNVATADSNETGPDTDDAIVPVGSNPSLNITKTATPTSLSFGGGSVTYTYVVTNPGNVSLNTVTVTDVISSTTTPACTPTGPIKTGGNDNANLDPGETWTYSCTKTITVSTSNTATATGLYGDDSVSATASASVTVGQRSDPPVPPVPPVPPTGSLTITKVLNPATAFPGGTFTFDVSCAQQQTITLAAGQATGSVTINGLTIGSTCTVTEVTPLTSAGAGGWQWVGQPQYGPGQTVSVPNTVTVTNFRGEVAGVIATPRVTLPPTDSLDSGTSSSPGVNLGLILLLFSGIMTVLGFLTPVPARARRRDRRD